MVTEIQNAETAASSAKSADDTPFPLTDIDRWVLSLTDEEFPYHDWKDMTDIIRRNDLSILKRKPSDLRRYMKWTSETKAEYGSMTEYLLCHRLPSAWGRPPFVPASLVPFEDPSDYRVLINDWPYGITADMTHIVVWTRTVIETDNTVGDMVPQSRRLVTEFVRRFFVERLGPGGEDKVLFFKNWVALQSVRALEHIHVIVRDAPREILEDWTQELECHREAS
ncbi:DUF3605 domain-containing protein [Microdochium nivale]|nr:DUF3605 domain-containing protein [Microdochium nivale]